MRKILVFQNSDILETDSLRNMNNYIQQGIDKGVVVIDDRIKYEVIEIDDAILE